MQSRPLSVEDTVVTDTNPIRYDVVLRCRNVSEDEIREYIEEEYFNPRLLCFPYERDIGRVVVSEDDEVQKVKLKYEIAEWCRERLEDVEEL